MILPTMFLKPEGIMNDCIIIAKIFICVEIISIYNHTVILGNIIHNLFTAMQLRSVGKNNKKYQSIGGIMGVTFIRSAEMSREMYEAMQCRGFTDDYRWL